VELPQKVHYYSYTSDGWGVVGDNKMVSGLESTSCSLREFRGREEVCWLNL